MNGKKCFSDKDDSTDLKRLDKIEKKREKKNVE
jgi:hypothetical protein